MLDSTEIKKSRLKDIKHTYERSVAELGRLGDVLDDACSAVNMSWPNLADEDSDVRATAYLGYGGVTINAYVPTFGEAAKLVKILSVNFDRKYKKRRDSDVGDGYMCHHHGPVTIWVYLTGDGRCRRVLKDTKMVKQEIYEWVCD